MVYLWSPQAIIIAVKFCKITYFAWYNCFLTVGMLEMHLMFTIADTLIVSGIMK
jgi:hypothetical protein